MASNTRRQLENWLKTIDVSGSVLDVGGLTLPVYGRTKTWDVHSYAITDIKEKYKGRTVDRVWDFNEPIPAKTRGDFDNIFW